MTLCWKLKWTVTVSNILRNEPRKISSPRSLNSSREQLSRYRSKNGTRTKGTFLITFRRLTLSVKIFSSRTIDDQTIKFLRRTKNRCNVPSIVPRYSTLDIRELSKFPRSFAWSTHGWYLFIGKKSTLRCPREVFGNTVRFSDMGPKSWWRRYRGLTILTYTNSTRRLGANETDFSKWKTGEFERYWIHVSWNVTKE